MDDNVAGELSTALAQLFAAVSQLQKAYPQKPFTLDGRLVGDIGEIVASLHYQITLNEGLTKYHDAVSDDGRNVQIKATFSTRLTFPAWHVPDYYIGIRLNRDGSFEEVYNGPGHLISEALLRRAKPKYGLHGGLMPMLKRLNLLVPQCERIPRRHFVK
ncbi:DUF6998 domain-containing protein [Pseudomonas oryzihabitans]|uniref:DUF6998 domain-containing protein n=1 Tax=Pseudomonas oryzihabitans TaxID=47885 RepID=UPI000942D7C1|nr:hypothetical protein [Pseudomonas psychrotolerans]NMY89813.1 hypothetical protein [Pseudomonas psychrotolerans]